MKLQSIIFISLVIFSLLNDTDARGGGGRGGRGGGRGGRGRSGVRGGVGRSRPQMKSSIRGSSSLSGGVRTGTSGWKLGSKTSSFSNYGSTSFRQSTFANHPNVQVRAGHPFVIISAFQPMLYDSRNYYWSYGMIKHAHNSSSRDVICEYVFGTDDGDLQNITYQNGTEIKSIFFPCVSSSETCCGMYCCYDFDQWFNMLFVIGFICLMAFIGYYAKRRELATYGGSSDAALLREKTPTSKTSLTSKSSLPCKKSPPKL